jgi:hypothetical protein
MSSRFRLSFFGDHHQYNRNTGYFQALILPKRHHQNILTGYFLWDIVRREELVHMRLQARKKGVPTPAQEHEQDLPVSSSR